MTLQNALGNLALDATVTSVKNAVDAVTAAVDGLETNTTGLATQTTLALAKTALDNILLAVDGLETNTTGLATQATLAQVKTAVDAVTAAVNALTFDTTGLALDATLLDIQAAVEAVQAAVEGTLVVSDGGGSLTVDGTVNIGNFPAATEIVNDVGNPIPVNGTVTANAGTGPWPVTDNGSSLTVDGTVAVSNPGLTDAELRATAVPVSDGGGSLTVDGPLTDGQIRATPLPVSGTVTATGPLTDVQLRAAVVPISDGGGSITIDGSVSSALAGVVLANSTSNLGGGATFNGTATQVMDVANAIFYPTAHVYVMAGGITRNVGYLSFQEGASSGAVTEVRRIFIPNDFSPRTFCHQWSHIYGRVSFINGPGAQTSFELRATGTASPTLANVSDVVTYEEQNGSVSANTTTNGLTHDIGMLPYFRTHRVLVNADAAGVVTLEQSQNSSTWRTVDSYSLGATESVLMEVPIAMRYVRWKFLQGATGGNLHVVTTLVSVGA